MPSFTRAEATRNGVRWRRLAAPDLERTFHGVRRHVGAEPSIRELAEAYAKRMPRRQVFSHVTAAALWGIPVPRGAEIAHPGPVAEGASVRPLLHVAVPRGSARPTAAGVRGHVISFETVQVIVHGGLRVVDPASAWIQLGASLAIDDLVAAAEYLITGSEPFDGRLPLCDRGQLESALAAHPGRRGLDALRRALAAARWGALSRRETLLRLDLVRAGLPEPVPNHRVLDGRGELIAMIDLAYPDRRVGIEYQSDRHRSGAQWRRDIRRIERLADAGWVIVQATSDDVSADGELRDSAAFADRVRRRLEASRSGGG
ncbi:endonuclease domain-containing protein [Agromyces sp. M3QZ16-3]|uniref:endonuclease domain-containing protein n=1 Tax=Agromyces sp. M3QZ16-3 TaxID=3447585 RepID=UPI003F693F7C